MEVIFSLIVAGILFASLSSSLAKQKGYTNVTIYAVLGFLFSAFGLLYVVGLPDLIAKNQRATIINHLQDINKQANGNISQYGNAIIAEKDTELPPL